MTTSYRTRQFYTSREQPSARISGIGGLLFSVFIILASAGGLLMAFQGLKWQIPGIVRSGFVLDRSHCRQSTRMD